MKKTIKIAALLLTITLAFTECKKVEGPKGEPGNANVQSFQKTLLTQNWIKNPNNSWSQLVTFPELTEDAVNNGAILCYINIGGWTALPFSIANTQFYAEFQAGYVKFYTNKLDGSAYTNQPDTWNFKIVIIPQGVRKAHINYENYQQFARVQNLSE